MLEHRGEPQIPADLSRHDCIIDTYFREPGRWPFRDDEGGLTGAHVTGRIRYSNAEACLDAPEAGLGLACVPSFVAGDALRAGRARRVLQAFETAPFTVHALYPHSRHLAGKVRVLVDFLVDRYGGEPPWESDW